MVSFLEREVGLSPWETKDWELLNSTESDVRKSIQMIRDEFGVESDYLMRQYLSYFGGKHYSMWGESKTVESRVEFFRKSFYGDREIIGSVIRRFPPSSFDSRWDGFMYLRERVFAGKEHALKDFLRESVGILREGLPALRKRAEVLIEAGKDPCAFYYHVFFMTKSEFHAWAALPHDPRRLWHAVMNKNDHSFHHLRSKADHLVDVFKGDREAVRSIIFRLPLVLAIKDIPKKIDLLLDSVFLGNQQELRMSLLDNPGLLAVRLCRLQY